MKPFENISVLENVMVGAITRSNQSSKAKQEAEEILKFVNLWKYQNYKASALTISNRKILEFARVLATRPSVVLLDEVMAGLNPAEIDEILGIIQRVSETGITLIVVEHVMKVVMTLCDRIVVLNHGEKIAEGSPEEISKNELVIKAYLGEGFSNAPAD